MGQSTPAWDSSDPLAVSL